MGKYYIGLDTSTSSTGFCIINEKCEIEHWECIATKKQFKNSGSLGAGYRVISEAYNQAFYKIAQEIYKKDPIAHFVASIECNTVQMGYGKGLDVTMKLGITVGLAIANLLKNFYIEEINLVSANNWRTKLVVGKTRDELKIEVCNWVEKLFKKRLPLYEVESDGIKHDGYYDCRNNDIADSVGLAYCGLNNLLADRKVAKNTIKFHKELKDKFDKYKKEYEENIIKNDIKKAEISLTCLKNIYNLLVENKIVLKKHTKYMERIK